MPDFRKGASAIKESQERSKTGGDFVPFTPSLFWTQDGDSKEKYVLFLNPMDEIVTANVTGFIPVAVKGRDKPMFEQVIARTDPAIGESTDPMSDDWDADPKETCISVAVVLDPVIEEVNGRKRPVGFEVATNTYERRIKDAEGKLTEEKEEVEVPVLGFVTQSPFNFFNLVQSFDESDGPIEGTALKIKRIDKNTYSVDGYVGADIDLSGLVDCIDGLSYLGDDTDNLLTLIDEIYDDPDIAADEAESEAALTIGSFLLDKRLAELCDRERYDRLYEGIDKPFRFGKKSKNNDSKSSDKPAKRERPARRSQRRGSEDAAPDNVTPEDNAQEPDATPEPEAEAPAEKPARKARASRAAKPKAEPKTEAPAEDSPTAGKSKLDELRERNAKRRAA